MGEMPGNPTSPPGMGSWNRMPGPVGLGPPHYLNPSRPPGPEYFNRSPGPHNWIRPPSLDYWNRSPGSDDWIRPPGPDNLSRSPDPDNWVHQPGPDNWIRPPGPDNWIRQPGQDNWSRQPGPDNWNLRLNPPAAGEVWNPESNAPPRGDFWNPSLYAWPQAARAWNQVPVPPYYWHPQAWNPPPMPVYPGPWRGGGIPIPMAVGGNIVTRQIMPIGTGTLRTLQLDPSVSQDGISLNLDVNNGNFKFILPRTSSPAVTTDEVLTVSDEEDENDKSKSLQLKPAPPSINSLSDGDINEIASVCSDNSSLQSGSCASPWDQEQIEEETESESESETNCTSWNCELRKGDEKAECWSQPELLPWFSNTEFEVEVYHVCESEEEETVSASQDDEAIEDDKDIQAGLLSPVPPVIEEFDSSYLYAARVPEEPVCNIPVMEGECVMDIDDDQNTKLAASPNQIQVPLGNEESKPSSEAANIPEKTVCTPPPVIEEFKDDDHNTKVEASPSQIQVCVVPPVNEEFDSSCSDTARITEEQGCIIPSVKGEFMDDDQTTESIKLTAIPSQIQVEQPRPVNEQIASSTTGTVKIPEEPVSTLRRVKFEFKDDDGNINLATVSSQIEVDQPSSVEANDSSSSDTSTIPEESVCTLLPVKGEFMDDDQSTKGQANLSSAPGYSKATEVRVGIRCEINKALETNKREFQTTENEAVHQSNLKPELKSDDYEAAKPGSSKETSVTLKGSSKISLVELQKRMETLKLSAEFKNRLYRAYFNLGKLPSTKKIRCLVIGTEAACNLTIKGIMKYANVFGINQFKQMKPDELDTYYDKEEDFRAKIREESIMYFVYMRDCDEGLDLRKSDFLRHLKMLSRLNVVRNVDVMLWRRSTNNNRNYPSAEGLDQILVHTGLSYQTFYHDQVEYHQHLLSFLAHRMQKVAQIDFGILQKKMMEVERQDGNPPKKRTCCDPGVQNK